MFEEHQTEVHHSHLISLAASQSHLERDRHTGADESLEERWMGWGPAARETGWNKKQDEERETWGKRDGVKITILAFVCERDSMKKTEKWQRERQGEWDGMGIWKQMRQDGQQYHMVACVY